MVMASVLCPTMIIQYSLTEYEYFQQQFFLNFTDNKRTVPILFVISDWTFGGTDLDLKVPGEQSNVL